MADLQEGEGEHDRGARQRDELGEVGEGHSRFFVRSHSRQTRTTDTATHAV